MRIVRVGANRFFIAMPHVFGESLELICERCSLYKDPLCWNVLCGGEYFKELKSRGYYEKEDSITCKKDDSSCQER